MMTLKVYVCFTDLKSMVVVSRYSIFTISVRSGGALAGGAQDGIINIAAPSVLERFERGFDAIVPIGYV